MNGVIGMSQMLLDQAADEEVELFSRTIRDSAEALLLIVNDTLDVSRLEAGRVDLRPAPLDLEALMIDCIRLASATGRAGVQVALDYPLHARTGFMGDEGRIRQIVMNLMGNALKFTDAGHVIARVALDTSVEEMRVRITVEDTGPGVPADMADQIFEAFGQVDDPSRPAREGTGLGLTISRGLAERMGGTLELVSTGAQGATFALTLPLQPHGDAPVAHPVPARLTVPDGGGARGAVAAGRLRAAGAIVDDGVTEDCALALVPLSLPHSAQDDLLSRLPERARVVLLGRHVEAVPALLARAETTLTVPVTGADLLLALTRSAPAPAAPVPPDHPAEPRLLIADDNATNRLLIERMLRDQPFVVEVVTDGAEAVAAYAADPPAAAILDISMPNVDGFEAARQIRALEADRGLPAMPLLALTAHVGDDMGARLKAEGFAAFLTKPLRKDVLLDALAAALDIARA